MFFLVGFLRLSETFLVLCWFSVIFLWAFYGFRFFFGGFSSSFLDFVWDFGGCSMSFGLSVVFSMAFVCPGEFQRMSSFFQSCLFLPCLWFERPNKYYDSDHCYYCS